MFAMFPLVISSADVTNVRFNRSASSSAGARDRETLNSFSSCNLLLLDLVHWPVGPLVSMASTLVGAAMGVANRRLESAAKYGLKTLTN